MKRILNTSVFRAKCWYCDCEFEYQSEDIFYNALRGSRVVSCPTCHRHINHNDSVKSNTSTEQL